MDRTLVLVLIIGMLMGIALSTPHDDRESAMAAGAMEVEESAGHQPGGGKGCTGGPGGPGGRPPGPPPNATSSTTTTTTAASG